MLKMKKTYLGVIMITEEKKELLSYYNKALELYKLRNFSEALGFFSKAKDIDPNDGPTNLYIDRCKTYITDPPANDWDGVFVMTTK